MQILFNKTRTIIEKIVAEQDDETSTVLSDKMAHILVSMAQVKKQNINTSINCKKDYVMFAWHNIT